MQDGCWQLWSRLFLQKGDGKKLTDKCAEMIVEVYLQDMTAKRATVKDIHKLQGFERKSQVAIEVDKQYKNPLINAQKNSLHTSHTDQRHSL